MKKIVVPLVVLVSFSLLLAVLGTDSGMEVRIGVMDSYMEDIEVVQRREGDLLWSLRAVAADIAESGDEVLLHSVTVSFPRKGMELLAREGVYHVKGGGLSLEDHIQARVEGYLITADALNIVDNGTLEAEGMVVLEGDGVRVEGERLRALENGLLRLTGGVQAVFE